jgi:hypothetical protein
MKKTLLKLLSLGVMTFGSATLFAQTMYLDEMFNVSKQANIVYDSNRSVLTNRQATGNKEDSAVVEMCTRLAKRGFNAIAVNYRQGWNAAALPPTSTEQLLNATYRGAQDMRNAVRFLHLNAATYGIDTIKLLLVDKVQVVTLH